MSGRSNIFKNQVFAIAGIVFSFGIYSIYYFGSLHNLLLGTLNFRSHDEIIKTILNNGGSFQETVTPSTTIALSTEEMGFTLGYVTGKQEL